MAHIPKQKESKPTPSQKKEMRDWLKANGLKANEANELIKDGDDFSREEYAISLAKFLANRS